MLSHRRERFQRLIYQACALNTEDLANWVTNEALAKHRELLLSRLACLRIYASRVDECGETYARQRDRARVRLGIPSTRLSRRMSEDRWELADDLKLRAMFLAATHCNGLQSGCIALKRALSAVLHDCANA